MRCMLIALPFWLWGAVFGVTVALPHLSAQQCEEQVPNHQAQQGSLKYVVIFTTELGGDPFEFRMVVKANSENEAVLVACITINKQFGNSLDLATLRLKEVAQKKE